MLFDKHTSANLLFLLIWISALFAIEGIASGTDSEENATGTQTSQSISGVVLDELSFPIKDAHLKVFRFEYDPRRHYQLITERPLAPDGSFRLMDFEPGSYLFRVDVEGYAPAWKKVIALEGESPHVTIHPQRPGSVIVKINDQHGLPVPNAELRWFAIHSSAGVTGFGHFVFESLNLQRPRSNQDGVLRLDNLPIGATLSVGVQHEDYVPAELETVAIQVKPDPQQITLEDGIRMTMQIEPTRAGLTLKDVEIDLRHSALFDNTSTMIAHVLELDDDGRTGVTISPGSYRYLSLKHPEYLVSPQFSPKITQGEFLKLSEDVRFTFTPNRKIKITGRVINANTGQPVINAIISGEIPNACHDDSVDLFGQDWMHAERTRTDQKGAYSLNVARGKIRVHFSDKGFAQEGGSLVMNLTDEVTNLPDLIVHPLKPINGRVVDIQEKPVSGAIVRFRGSNLRSQPPVQADSNGHFELDVPFLPFDEISGQRILKHEIVAFDPYQPKFGRQSIDLGNLDSESSLIIQIQPQRGNDLPGLFPDELTAWERNEIDPERRTELERISLIGQPAPALDGRKWLNTDGKNVSLNDFRGQYVLLDFWTTWCGPCHQDFPSLKLLHELYSDKGLTMIGVHDNSVEPDAIAEHVLKEQMPFPIVIDQADGRILRAYGEHGISGYPSYVLIDPNGNVLIDDDTQPGPTLRVFKIELIRELLMNAGRLEP